MFVWVGWGGCVGTWVGMGVGVGVCTHTRCIHRINIVQLLFPVNLQKEEYPEKRHKFMVEYTFPPPNLQVLSYDHVSCCEAKPANISCFWVFIIIFISIIIGTLHCKCNFTVLKKRELVSIMHTVYQ